MYRKSLTFLSLLSMVAACSPATTTSSTNDYYEDITVYRPKYEVQGSQAKPIANSIDSINIDSYPQMEAELDSSMLEISYKLDSLLDSIAVNNQQIKYYQGYTIQVYTGNSSDEANKVKSEVYRILPNSRPRVTYDLPNYKVKVGKYYNRLEANENFAMIRRKFGSAILVPQQFRIEDN